jgi:hypothetical protein
MNYKYSNPADINRKGTCDKIHTAIEDMFVFVMLSWIYMQI